MAELLYRWGRFCFDRRRVVVLVWVGFLAVLAFGAAKAPTAVDEGLSMPGTESQQAFDLLDQRFPGMKSDGAEARIVFVAPEGQMISSAANKAEVGKVVAEVAQGGQVAAALDPFQAGAVSENGTTAYATIAYDASSIELSDETKAALGAAVDNGRAAGLTVEVGGSALQPAPEMGGATEIIGVAVAAVVLLLTFGSLAAAGLPLLTAMVGIGIGVAGVVVVGMSSTTTILALMLGLAVGIDYALFIVSRYRAERGAGRSPRDAIAYATGTAGSAVVFAGCTVVIALAGLSVVGIPALTKMGLAAAGTVTVAVAIAVTLLPALLGFAQNAVLPRSERGRKLTVVTDDTGNEGAAGAAGTGAGKDSMGTRWARFVVRRPAAVLILAVVGLGVLALPAKDLALGLPDDGSQAESTTQRRAYDALAEGFGPGFNGPLTVVIDAADAGDRQAAVGAARATLVETSGVVSVSPPRFNEAGDTALLTAVPATAPTDLVTKDLVHALRGEAGDLEIATGARMHVTGSTAMNIDVSQKLSDALLPYLAVVVGLAFLLLMLVFRSLLVPLKATLGFLLSICAALGVIVAVFQWGWLADLLGVEQVGPIMSMMPIFMIGVVFGLAMDYEVFLVTRIREGYIHGESAKQAIVTGFRHSARVVAAAAVIMIAVFAGFIGMHETMIKMMGVGLSAAVLFDALIVRMTIVPAVLALLGDTAWWLPGWLQKVLPNVDVEGENLRSIEQAGGDEKEKLVPSRA